MHVAPLRAGRAAALGVAWTAALALGCGGGESRESTASGSPLEVPASPEYVAYRASAPLTIDGRLDDVAWSAAAWSRPFMDIVGPDEPKPRWRTRFRLLWDERYLYVAAELEEPQVWATLVERDAVIYHDNDFELFLDPDGDTHHYFEFEINALGTVWDLLLEKPYRDGGPAVTTWNIAGLQSAVAVLGTLNDPSDRDRGWTVELAIPWEALAESERAGPPKDGELWMVNFSRVEWDTRIVDGAYVKATDSVTGRALREHNWVWSPQGAVDMHRPERWGVVQFSSLPAGRSTARVRPLHDADVRWALRRLYYAEREYRSAHDAYTGDTAALGLHLVMPDGKSFEPALTANSDGYEAVAAGRTGRWHISADGRVWHD